MGVLKVVHPAIDVPAPGMDWSCAHMTIVNDGSTPVHLIGVEVSAATRTDLLQISGPEEQVIPRAKVEIVPGAPFHFRRGNWCLFLTGITGTLEPDMAVIGGALYFEELGRVPVEFMVDAGE